MYEGRYAMPELPTATYEVFVRGYGLVDSPRVTASRVSTLDLTAVIAPDGRAAAQIYPAKLLVESRRKFRSGRLSQEEVIGRVKLCMNCHPAWGQSNPGDSCTTKDFGPFKNSLGSLDRRRNPVQ